jgi:hypothetical protein
MPGVLGFRSMVSTHLCSMTTQGLGHSQNKGLGLLPKPLVFCEYRLMYILTLNHEVMMDV